MVNGCSHNFDGAPFEMGLNRIMNNSNTANIHLIIDIS